MTEKELIVRKIENGTVIDHITPGRALDVLKVLNITGKEGLVGAVVMNVPSKKDGKKGRVKIENRELAEEEVNLIAMISPNATINIIRDHKVAKKFQVKIPNKIKNIIQCENPTCITRVEKNTISSFTLVSRSPIILRCDYCGAYIDLEAILKQFE